MRRTYEKSLRSLSALRTPEIVRLCYQPYRVRPTRSSPPVNWPNLIETYSNAMNALAAEQVSEAEDDPDEAYAGIAGTVFSSGGSPATVGGGTSAAGDDAQAGDARPELDTSALPGQVDEQPNISASDEV